MKLACDRICAVMREVGPKIKIVAILAIAASFAFAAPICVESAPARCSAVFSSGGATLALSETNGAVESLVAADGSERIMAAAEAFSLQLLNGKGEPTRLKPIVVS